MLSELKEDLYYLSVKALIFNKNREILLLKVNPNRLIGKTMPHWDMPGGRANNNDTSILNTLQREIEEETGICTLQHIKPFITAVSPIRVSTKDNDSLGLIFSIYTCTLQCDDQIKLSNEHTQAGWFSLKEATELLQGFPTEFTEKLKTL